MTQKYRFFSVILKKKSLQYNVQKSQHFEKNKIQKKKTFFFTLLFSKWLVGITLNYIFVDLVRNVSLFEIASRMKAKNTCKFMQLIGLHLLLGLLHITLKRCYSCNK